jgi:hypothetical protein
MIYKSILRQLRISKDWCPYKIGKEKQKAKRRDWIIRYTHHWSRNKCRTNNFRMKCKCYEADIKINESARNWELEIPEAERPEAYLVYPEPWRYLDSTIGRVCCEASNDQASVKTYRGDTKVGYNAICTRSLIACSELRLWWLTCTLCLHREV